MYIRMRINDTFSLNPKFSAEFPFIGIIVVIHFNACVHLKGRDTASTSWFTGTASGSGQEPGTSSRLTVTGVRATNHLDHTAAFPGLFIASSSPARNRLKDVHGRKELETRRSKIE